MRQTRRARAHTRTQPPTHTVWRSAAHPPAPFSAAKAGFPMAGYMRRAQRARTGDVTVSMDAYSVRWQYTGAARSPVAARRPGAILNAGRPAGSSNMYYMPG